jgi:two-component sensor histidine kinase
VRDDGVGLPADFDLGKSSGLGMRIVAGLSKQLQAVISHRPNVDGAEFVLTLPLQRRPNS